MECVKCLSNCTGEELKEQEIEFIKSLNCLKNEKYVEKYFLFSASPVLAEIKPSVLIPFRRCCKDIWENCREHLCKMTGLCAVTLYENRETFVILIYSEKIIEQRVKTPQAEKILLEYGYGSDYNLAEMFERLKLRFTQCKFPHEIGVFLGYPPEDVEAFIEKSGRDYLCCRYWKVYHNEQRARETFRFIDEAKAQAINLLRRKVSIKTMAKMLAAM